MIDHHIFLSSLASHRFGFGETKITALGLIWYEGPPARPWGGLGGLSGWGPRRAYPP